MVPSLVMAERPLPALVGRCKHAWPTHQFAINSLDLRWLCPLGDLLVPFGSSRWLLAPFCRLSGSILVLLPPFWKLLAPKAVPWAPKGAQMRPKGCQRRPKGNPKERKRAPEGAKRSPKEPTWRSKEPKGNPTKSNWEPEGDKREPKGSC